ncbi:MAG: hypothetical protein JJV93_01225 [Alphaproteobacteria bacterium]|nr:hypothetical protein [Alphaproteobacteria bacterium]
MDFTPGDLSVGDVVMFDALQNFRGKDPDDNIIAVCVYISEGWCLKINSKNRPMYHCIKITKEECFYLDKDSYLSCHPIIKIPNNYSVKGVVSSSFVEKIIEQIEQIEIFSGDQESKILNSLNNYLKKMNR